MESNRKERIERILFVCFVAAALLTAVSAGMEARTDISYTPYNGDWQHYNMFRRLLAGQIPFVDFPVVLGQGILYLNSAVLSVIGNSFANSILSTTAVGWAAGFFLTACILYLFTEHRTAAAGISLAMMLVILLFAAVQAMPMISGSPLMSGIFSFLDRIFSRFAVLFLPGNSSRPTRMAVIALYLAFFYCLSPKLVWKRKQGVFWKEPVLFGAFGGLMILWANDNGSAAYIGASFLFFLLILKKAGFRDTILGTLIYIISTLATVFAVMLLITRGQISAWFRQTFAVTDFLWWYDGVFFDRKRLGVLQYPPFSGECVIPIAVCAVSLVVWMIQLFKREERRERTAAGHVMLLTSSFVFLYLNLLKNGYEEQYTNIFIVYTYLMVCYLPVRFLLAVMSGDKTKTVVRRLLYAAGCLIVAVAVVFSWNSLSYAREHGQPDEAFIEALDGNCYAWYPDLNAAYREIGDATLFSTYGSALEVMKGAMQPTRYDYITHVFGNESRADYLETFRKTQPEYVSILNRDFTRWEAWACNANWFFYREVADHYRFSFANTFCRYLVRTTESNEVQTEVFAEILPVSGTETTIRLTAAEHSMPLIADVCIRYDSSFTRERLRSLTVNRLIAVTGTAEYLYPAEDFDAWFLPDTSEGYYLPVLIEDGVGEITISSMPRGCTSLDVSSVEVGKIYDFERVFGGTGEALG